MSHQGTCPIRLLLRPRALHAITRESKGCSYKGWKHPALLTCCCTGTPSCQQVIRIKQLGWITSSPISLAPWHGSKESLIVASPSPRPQLVVCRRVGCLGSRLPALPPSSKVLRRKGKFSEGNKTLGKLPGWVFLAAFALRSGSGRAGEEDTLSLLPTGGRQHYINSQQDLLGGLKSDRFGSKLENARQRDAPRPQNWEMPALPKCPLPCHHGGKGPRLDGAMGEREEGSCSLGQQGLQTAQHPGVVPPQQLSSSAPRQLSPLKPVHFN